ncbi:peroxide-responsive transcriptional repressor PerR [Streptococcus dysgalactiae]|uniref:peroxide-responsive transcriptional repressor PerR n=1 Tax=Streptococcus dysgalactiae TaxID=1334 RepID=UPI0013FD6DB7|nr:peroxide-responsive transcriptional repressor PerR [Streptococcus dysgalactiae]
MDIHSHQQALDAYENVLEHLREKHIRITETRKAIISYMIQSTEHPSADKIYRDLQPKFPNMSLATVYNNLKVLVDEGFVAELKISNDLTTYYDFMGHQHVNVVCEVCGKIADFMDVDVLDIAKEAQQQTGYKVTRIPVIAYGICPECQAKGKSDF